MNPTQHVSNNRVLGAPQGWDQQSLTCTALAVTLTEVDGALAMVSYWRPDPHELALLNAGGLVALSVFGGGMPPVALTACKDGPEPAFK
jgi:hypothetical protein